MKFVIAASAAIALASAAEEKAAADSCKKGIKIQVFLDKDCTKEAAYAEGDKEGDLYIIEQTDDQAAKLAKCHDFKHPTGTQSITVGEDVLKIGETTTGVPLVLGNGMSMKNTCDKEGMKTQVFKKAGCEGEADTTTFKWGKCMEFPAKINDKKAYYQFSGASAIQATAAAVLAFIGTQF